MKRRDEAAQEPGAGGGRLEACHPNLTREEVCELHKLPAYRPLTQAVMATAEETAPKQDGDD